MNMLFLGLGILVSGGFVSFAFPRGLRSAVATATMVAGSACVGWASVGVLLSGSVFSAELVCPFPLNAVPFVLDPLSAFFALLVAIGAAASSLYTVSYLRPYEGKSPMAASHPCLVNLLAASMILVVTIQHAIAFLVVWEIMSLVSFLLVLFENEKDEVLDASLYYLVAMHVGVVLLTVAFVLASSRAGSYRFADLSGAFDTAVLALFFAGFAFTAGLFPFHTWLPLAHPAAPSNVSALMSGVMIKTGLYGILRMFSLGGPSSGSLVTVFLALSVVTAVYGIIYALVQKDYKRLLAYSSIENVGIVGIGLSAGLLGCTSDNPALAFLGFTGGLLHALNHAIIKPLLFFCAGEVYQATHTRIMDALGGLGKRMRGTAGCFFLGAASISALPPLNGFTGEFFMYLAFLTGVQSHDKGLVGVTVLLFAALAFVGFLALAAFTMAGGVIFLGEARTDASAHAEQGGRFALLPIGILAACVVAFGFFPGVLVRLALPVASELARAFGVSGGAAEGEILKISNVAWKMSEVFLLFAAIFGVLWIARRLLLRNRPVRESVTWGCGYRAGTPRIQYTASSFAEPVVSLFRYVLRLNERRVKPEGLFPFVGMFSRDPSDPMDELLVHPVARGGGRLTQAFAWIQSGESRQYILYGLAFLLIAILVVLGGAV